MNLDPVQFQSSRFENADHTVAFCRETLAVSGFTREANRLQQVAVTDCDMARTALTILSGMKVSGPRALEAWASAIYALRGALRSCGALGTA
jgi:hypothetical protein